MDKKLIGLLGVAAGLASLGPAQAIPSENTPGQSGALQATSYADLLTPVQNAAELLVADDAVRVQTASVKVADNDHHHHHHVIVIKHNRHKHHHHHHHSSYMAIPRGNA